MNTLPPFFNTIVVHYLPILVCQPNFLSTMRIMEGVYFPVSAAVIFGICLHLVINGPCMAYPELQTGSNDTIIIAGERLTLQCIFSELPVGKDSVLWTWWRRSRTMSYVGRCDMNGHPGRECDKFQEFRNDSRISLIHRERQMFQLMISNITIYDAGFYECGREGGNISGFHSLHSIQVTVVPLQETYTTHESTKESTSPGISGNTIQSLLIFITSDMMTF